WHRHYAGANPFADQLLVSRDGKADLTARRDDDHFWIAPGGIREHIGPLRNAGSRRILFAIESGKRLTRQGQDRGLMAQLHDKAISLDYFVGVAGAQSYQAGDGSQRNEMLDWLVSRTILAISHGVMSENKQTGQLHQCGQPNCRTRVIAEYKERRSKSP